MDEVGSVQEELLRLDLAFGKIQSEIRAVRSWVMAVHNLADDEAVPEMMGREDAQDGLP